MWNDSLKKLCQTCCLLLPCLPEGSPLYFSTAFLLGLRYVASEPRFGVYGKSRRETGRYRIQDTYLLFNYFGEGLDLEFGTGIEAFGTDLSYPVRRGK